MNFKKAINKGIAFSAGITILIVTILGLKVSKQFSLPIKKVSDTSVQLSEGNYGARSEVQTNIKELNYLTDSINTLGQRLKQQDTLRKRLVADISHELRTPLNILQNNLEAMIDKVLPVTTERLEGLNEEVVRFSKLIDNLEALKEIEMEKGSIEKVPLFMDDLVESVCQDFRVAAKEKGIEIHINIQPNVKYLINGDENKLRQVLINIISNAMKFIEQGKNIWIELGEKHNKIRLSIKDDGMGINKEDLPFIFERMYRGDKSRYMVDGSGIGLTIVKSILKLHSAELEVVSSLGNIGNVGKGTEFIIFFYKSS